MAGEVTLEWDFNIEPDIAGYVVYWGPTSRNYSDSVDVGNQNSYADIDHDGDVSSTDMTLFMAEYGGANCSNSCDGDFDSDGDEDGSDFTLIVKSYGKSGCP
jgi:hypothetical protein